MPKMSSLTELSAFFAQAAAPATSTGGDTLRTFLPMVLLFGAMYFFMIAPQRKKQKEHQKMLTELQSGDEIVTNGGIYGVITNVKEDRFIVRIAENTKIELGKGFIQTVVNKTPAAVEKK